MINEYLSPFLLMGYNCDNIQGMKNQQQGNKAKVSTLDKYKFWKLK